ncbi:hypothetical protein GCM10027341_38600 [Spirosoma knui]
MAQKAERSVRLHTNYNDATYRLEQAVETIEAVNTVEKIAAVDYRAGQSVTLLPGFQAKAGSRFVASIKPMNATAELSMRLLAYPNPFEQFTTIEYYLPADSKVNLWIADAQGKIIKQIITNVELKAGKHQVNWQPDVAAPGVYVPVIEANDQKVSGRIVRK